MLAISAQHGGPQTVRVSNVDRAVRDCPRPEDKQANKNLAGGTLVLAGPPKFTLRAWRGETVP
jgi:hypothetical protein